VDYHRNSSNPMAARLFRSEYKSRLSANGRMDPYSARYCRHPRHIAPSWCNVIIALLIKGTRPRLISFNF